MIVDVPKVYIGGVEYPVYGVNFNLGGNQPSTLSVSFVNQSGSYSHIPRSTASITKIQVGNFFTFLGYCVSSTLEEGVSGKFLNVEYVDTSVILDKYFVGLKGKHGPGFTTAVTGFSNNLILVGSQIDPCAGAAEINDNCYPCKDADGNQLTSEIDCERNKEITILDVEYSFDELLTSIYNVCAVGSIPQGINTDFKRQYVGSLRSVLNNWCSDYGWTFYWDNGIIYFVDLSAGININDSGVDRTCRLLNYQENYSISDFATKANILYFGQDGEVLDYSCSQNEEWSFAKKIVLKPLTLEDALVQNGRIDPFISRHYLNSLKFEQLIGLSKYSEAYRDLYALYNIYEIETPANAEAYRDSKQRLSLLGNMKIKKVCHAESSDEQDSAIYYNYFGPNSPVSPFTPDQREVFIRNGAYIVIAEQTDEVRQKFLNFETSVADNFMGRYWYRFFEADLQDGFDYQNHDGTLTYYKRGNELALRLTKDFPETVDSFSSFLQEIDQGNGEAIDNFILLERDQAWLPQINGSDDVLALNGDGEIYGPFSKSNDLSDKLEPIPPGIFQETQNSNTSSATGLTNSNVENKPWRAFIFFSNTTDNQGFKKLEVSNTEQITNPIEVPNKDIRAESFSFIVYYGLRSAKTRSFQIQTPLSKFRIIFPVQSGFTPGTNYGGVTIVGRGRITPQQTQKTLPKIEKVYLDIPTVNLDKSTSLDVNYIDVTSNLDSYLGASCTRNSGAIDSYMQSYITGIKTANSVENKTVRYSLAGIPVSAFTIRDGVSSFTISVNDNGSNSEISFSNLPPAPKTEDLIFKNNLESLMNGFKNKKMLQSRKLKQPITSKPLVEI